MRAIDIRYLDGAMRTLMVTSVGKLDELLQGLIVEELEWLPRLDVQATVSSLKMHGEIALSTPVGEEVDILTRVNESLASAAKRYDEVVIDSEAALAAAKAAITDWVRSTNS